MLLGLSFSNVCVRPELMTSMSCDSVYCICGAAWSSRCLMMQLTNVQHPLRACVRARGEHFEHTLWLSICFPILDKLYFSHRAWCWRWCSKSALQKQWQREGRRGHPPRAALRRGWHLKGRKYGFLKFCRFWQIGICIADSDILHPIIPPNTPLFWDHTPNCQCSTTPHKAVCTPRNLHCWSDWSFTCCKTV